MRCFQTLIKGKVVTKTKLTYSVLFISCIGTVKKLQGNIIIFVEPLHNKRLEPTGSETTFTFSEFDKKDIRNLNF